MSNQCPICGGNHQRGAVAVHLGPEPAADVEGQRRCRVCGCTEARACEVLGIPCCWVTEDLCSACATIEQLVNSEDAGWPWLLTVLGEHAGRTLADQLEMVPYELQLLD